MAFVAQPRPMMVGGYQPAMMQGQSQFPQMAYAAPPPRLASACPPAPVLINPRPLAAQPPQGNFGVARPLQVSPCQCQINPAAIPRSPSGPQVQPARGNTVTAPVGKSAKDQKAINTITDLLKNDRTALKRNVVQCFKRVEEDDDCVDCDGLTQICEALANDLDLPLKAFGDLKNNFLCFDFDGSGMLEVNEVYKVVKHQLRQYRKLLGGETLVVNMPFRTLQQAGYTVYKELGRGSQGVAKLAKDPAGREFCVKCLKKDTMCASGIEELQEEFQTLQLLAHDNIAQVFEIFQDGQFYYMVGEPYHGGDFMTLTPRAKEQGVSMTEDWWRGIFRQCAEAVEFMHEQSMMHCDLKEPNIMIKTRDFRNPEVVIIDFGICRAMVTASNGMPGGTPGYMPPETIQQRKWFPRGDVFCLGVTFIQVLLDKSPPTGPRTTATPGGIFVEGCQTIQDIFNATLTRKPPLEMMPPPLADLTDLLAAMLDKDVRKRPTASQVLGLQWFEGALSPNSRKMRSRNDWATVGITKSFLARPSVADEGANPAMKALRELQRSLGGTNEGAKTYGRSS
ncbi:unnamed protein product [Effrenium voratum]|uniref:Protein kinase domain-containing protein n=1 Tax=Effrenium voratum TaxID=2562239 RepID=A0AA36J6V5_9DINO|nr:unnamed protein product [Effrenium voratum]CAJ1400271.1 unnamed protein product [Effrenium voratum]CAJ1433923.1 unnamed protein product [Effrenium voratum]